MLRYALLFAAVLCVPALAAAESTAPAWHAGWPLEALGIVVALALSVLLWLIRRVLATFIHLVVLTLAVGFMLLAFFGRDLGVYDALLGTRYAHPDTPLLRLRPPVPDGDRGVVEPYDTSAPSFEEFFRERED